MTVSVCAKHVDRTQSVMSELVDQLKSNGLIARVRDAADMRRTLVWLTDEARARIVEVRASDERERLDRSNVNARIGQRERADRSS